MEVETRASARVAIRVSSNNEMKNAAVLPEIVNKRDDTVTYTSKPRNFLKIPLTNPRASSRKALDQKDSKFESKVEMYRKQVLASFT